MRTREQAEDTVARVGLKPGDHGYITCIEIAERGWPAWRIAQYLNCSPALIYKLGGPEPHS